MSFCCARFVAVEHEEIKRGTSALLLFLHPSYTKNIGSILVIRGMPETFEEQYQKTLAFVQRIHAGQTRAKGAVPAWQHLANVSKILRLVFTETQEGAPEERETIVLAALGHDALEDTDVAEETLLEYFGERGLALITLVTNRYGDENPAPYVRQVIEAEEGARLIKLADLYDNCTSVYYTIFLHGPEWVERYFLPIVQPMVRGILPAHFEAYPAAATYLKDTVRLSYSMLTEAVARENNTMR